MHLQQFGPYAVALVVAPLAMAALAISAGNVGEGFFTSLVIVLVYAAFAIAGVLFISRKKEKALGSAAALGIMFGIINASLAVSPFIQAAHGVLETPFALFARLGISSFDPILYPVSFVLFWLIIFCAVALITRKK